jgi:hypothetical protein
MEFGFDGTGQFTATVAFVRAKHRDGTTWIAGSTFDERTCSILMYCDDWAQLGECNVYHFFSYMLKPKFPSLRCVTTVHLGSIDLAGRWQQSVKVVLLPFVLDSDLITTVSRFRWSTYETRFWGSDWADQRSLEVARTFMQGSGIFGLWSGKIIES